jgi:hypothetical protein
MRGIVAAVLIILGVALVPLADLGMWTERELLSTSEFTTLATDVVQRDEVKDALANRLADILVEQVPPLALGRFVLVPALKQALGTQQFQTVFEGAVQNMHTQLENGDDRLTLDLDAILPIVRDLVANVNEDVASQIPQQTGIAVITVVTRDNVPQLWAGVDIAREASWVVPLLSLLLMAAGVAVAKKRALALILAGLGVAAAALLVVLAIKLGREPLSNVAGSTVNLKAFDAGYEVITDSLVLQTAVLGLLGLVAALVGVGIAVTHRPDAAPAPWA